MTLLPTSLEQPKATVPPNQKRVHLGDLVGTLLLRLLACELLLLRIPRCLESGELTFCCSYHGGQDGHRSRCFLGRSSERTSAMLERMMAEVKALRGEKEAWIAEKEEMKAELSSKDRIIVGMATERWGSRCALGYRSKQ